MNNLLVQCPRCKRLIREDDFHIEKESLLVIECWGCTWRVFFTVDYEEEPTDDGNDDTTATTE